MSQAASRAFRMPTSRRVGLGLGLPALAVLFAGLAARLWVGTASADGIVIAIVGAPALLLSGLLVMVVVTVIDELPRAIRGDPVVTIRPDGLELIHVGLLAWSDIARISTEHRMGIGQGEDGRTVYTRLAIWPRDPDRARHRPFGRIIGVVASTFGWAPLGVFDYELDESLDDLVAEVRHYHTVED